MKVCLASCHRHSTPAAFRAAVQETFHEPMGFVGSTEYGAHFSERYPSSLSGKPPYRSAGKMKWEGRASGNCERHSRIVRQDCASRHRC
jgi:hypothetical protein